MYQKSILPYTLFPTYLPQANSLLRASQTDRQKILHPLFPKFFFTERAGPYPQAQLYWAGLTMEWKANRTSHSHTLSYVGIPSPHSGAICCTGILLCPILMWTIWRTDVSLWNVNSFNTSSIRKLYEVSRGVFSNLPPNSFYDGYGTALCRPLTCNKGELSLKVMWWFPHIRPLYN